MEWILYSNVRGLYLSEKDSSSNLFGKTQGCVCVCVCVYQPTAESPSQPAVTWHIISHTNKVATRLLEQVKLLNDPR